MINSDSAAHIVWVQKHATLARIVEDYFVNIPVGNGCAYLNATYPNWWQRINPSLLDMSSGQTSVLAMIHAVSDIHTPEWRRWSHDTLVAHGFILRGVYIMRYPELTQAWAKAIETHRRMNSK